jgi:hypothetical protein
MDKVTQMRTAGDEQLRIQERALLEAWQAYNAAPVAMRATLRRDVLSAEKSMQEVQKIVADQLYKERVSVERGTATRPLTGVYVPPMPVALRGIPMTVIASGAEDTTPEATATATA